MFVLELRNKINTTVYFQNTSELITCFVCGSFLNLYGFIVVLFAYDTLNFLLQFLYILKLFLIDDTTI